MSDLEKKSLEAHVDLCAERYDQLNHKLESMNQRLALLEHSVNDLNKTLQQFKQATVTTYLTWAGGIIAILCALVGWLASRVI